MLSTSVKISFLWLEFNMSSKVVYSGKSYGTTLHNYDDYHDNFYRGNTHAIPQAALHGHSQTKWKKTIYGYICVETDAQAETYDMFPITSQTMVKAIEQLEGFDYEWADFGEDKDYELPKDWKQAFYVYVDPAKIPTTISKHRQVACCAFEATTKYMQHWLGMMLDEDDRSWYQLNALVTSDGLPQKDSFAVIQQLIEPYGLGISSIIVPPNSRRFSEYAPFLVSLGCNPFFMGDGYTTNEKALEMMFPDEELRNTIGRELAKTWRFECREEPVKGCITMVQFQETKTGHNGGSTYRGPRSKGATTNSQGQRSWHMCVKLDRLENIKYNSPVALEPYKEYPGTSSFYFEGMKDLAGVVLGKKMDELRAAENKKWQQPTNSRVSSSSPVAAYPPAVVVEKPKVEIKSKDKSSPIMMRHGTSVVDVDDITIEEWAQYDWQYDEDATVAAEQALKQDKARALSGNNRPDLFAEVKKTDREINVTPLLTYPPVCEECQQSPGNTFYTASNGTRTKNCQWCGTLQEQNFDESGSSQLRQSPVRSL
jgi:hypothetical protein